MPALLSKEPSGREANASRRTSSREVAGAGGTEEFVGRAAGEGVRRAGGRGRAPNFLGEIAGAICRGRQDLSAGLSALRTAAGLGEDRGQQAGVEQVAAAEVFGFGRAQRAFGGLAQSGQFLRFQFAQAAWLLVEDQRAVADAANFFDEVADFLEHLAQFAVAALDENDFVPGIVALANLADAGRRGADLARAGLATLDGDAAAQNVRVRLRWAGRRP